jgi:hypothetical protein
VLVILDATINIAWGSSCDQVMAPLLVVAFGGKQFRVDFKIPLWLNMASHFTFMNKQKHKVYESKFVFHNKHETGTY